MCGNSSSETSSLIYLTEYPHPPHNPTATQPEAPPTIAHHGVTVIGTGNNDNEVGAGLAERHISVQMFVAQVQSISAATFKSSAALKTWSAEE